MAKKPPLTMSEIVESHKPKHFKYRFIISDDKVYDELNDQKYDISSLDTINDDMLVQEALKATYVEYPKEDMFHKAKEPVMFDRGVIVTRKMVTKADKKLLTTFLGYFDYNNMHYVVIKLRYEKFDIIEIFILT